MSIALDDSTDGRPPIDSATFRKALGSFVTGVTVMTARHGQEIAGITVNSFNSLSLDPPLVLWSLALAAPSIRIFRTADVFAVNILSDGQHDLARQFARPAENKFAGVSYDDGLHGVPLIEDAASHIECRVEQRHSGGDHELMIGRVLRVTSHDRPPLAYLRGDFGTFLTLTARSKRRWRM